ncbi:hypothetical protein HMPREF3213_00041 [Heyndrickxia coagulans]|uniref:Uncharacterized protein n=1 Tax=Heyndrickxia coagulans TaxID=1398 RepID=A0A133L4K0_HEYCO|nr:hypothetical protein HMPREF3213_00041 [Heyndrickxia coagulans]
MLTRPGCSNIFQNLMLRHKACIIKKSLKSAVYQSLCCITPGFCV